MNAVMRLGGAILLTAALMLTAALLAAMPVPSPADSVAAAQSGD
jgi:hypothetical protein